MSSSDLPPIDVKEEIEKFQAFSESKEVVFSQCLHKSTEYDKEKAELRCNCGAAWSGERLNELKQVLDKSK
jgi:hypothetical protein